MAQPTSRRFDRWMLSVIALLAAAVAGLALANSWLGVKQPELRASTVGGHGPIGLVFSQKMQAATVEARLVLEPALACRYSWEGSTLWIWPERALESGKGYSIRLEAGAAAEDGQTIRQAGSWTVQVRPPEIIYLSPAAEASDLWAADIAGGNTRQLTQSGAAVSGYGISWDGEWITYSASNAQRGSDLWAIARAGGQARRLVDCAGDLCVDPAWSPDGKRIAYSRKRFAVSPGETYTSAPRIWTVDPASGQTAPLFQDPAASGVTPAWSPDGRWMAFYSPATHMIHVLNLQTGKDLLLKTRSGVVGTFTADSKHFFYSDLETSETLPYGSAYVADLATDHVERLFSLIEEQKDLGQPAPSPDGTWVAVGERFRGGSFSTQLSVMQPDGSSARGITVDPTYTHGAAAWSLAGDWLAFQRVKIGVSAARPEVWAWNFQSGQSYRVASDATRPGWLP